MPGEAPNGTKRRFRATPYAARLANPGKFLYPAPLTTLSAAALRQKLGGEPAGGRRAQLYVHLPFCETICTFCPIHKYQLGPSSPVDAYVDALKTELRALSRLPFIEQLRFESIYFGGGTPSVTSHRHLCDIVDVIQSSFHLVAPQATFEGHFRTLTRETIRLVRSLGFNRLSAGIQTFDRDLRRALNLTPTHEEIQTCLDTAREEGLDDFNVDLMFNLPGQTPAIWQRDLQETVALRPSGVDVYETVMAHPTALHAQVAQGHLRRERDPGRLTEGYLAAERILGDGGYRQKNLFVWNREGFENRLLDCQADLRDRSLHIVGAGLTAYSVIEGESFINEASLRAYIDRVRETDHGIKWHHACTPREERERFMILSLEEFGFDRRCFAERFGEDMDREFAPQIHSFTTRGLIEPDASGYRLTPLGRAWAATMAVEFYGEPALRDIIGARLRRSYFGGMTSEEEFELPLFAAYHPRQVLRGWRDVAILVEFVRYLARQNRAWPREMATLLATALQRYGLPAIGWWCAALTRSAAAAARRAVRDRSRAIRRRRPSSNLPPPVARADVHAEQVLRR